MPIAPGTKLGQYEVQDYIGQGAMGVVYRAYHPGLERTGAVKVMQAITPDADTVARFRHEAKAVAQMRHPNIVNVYDFGEYEGAPYMVVEFVPGGNLASRMSEGKFDRTTALRYLRGIAAGLDYAHRHNIVHRDVKPANVLLTAEDTPVLADFGLAKLMQGSSVKSMTGVTTGTPAYMAPEQVTGSGVGPPADRYSLATMAYEMLTGVIPFDGEALMELLYAQVHRDPLPPSVREPSLNPAVDAVVMRGLAKDPAARWETSTAFVDALESALAQPHAAAVAQTVVMAPLASTVPLPAAAVAEKVTAPQQPETFVAPFPAQAQPPTPRRKARWPLFAMIAAALVAVLVIGTAGVIALTRTPTITLSADSVAPGEDVVISATHLPPNQTGAIQIFSVERTFGFRADSNGNVSIDITIPHDIGFGDHLVKLCYGNSCHAQTTLHVIQPVVSTTPTPSATAHPGSSPSPTAVTAPTVYVLKSSVKPGDSETVGGQHFPGSAVAVYFVQGKTDQQLGNASVSGGSFVTTVHIPSVAVAGPAAIRACYSGGCAFATITVS